jgi:hypothetical protein
MDTIGDPQSFLAAQQVAEVTRREHEVATQKRQAKLEMVRLAKDILIESARHQPMEYSAVTAAEITAFAQELINYVGE